MKIGNGKKRLCFNKKEDGEQQGFPRRAEFEFERPGGQVQLLELLELPELPGGEVELPELLELLGGEVQVTP